MGEGQVAGREEAARRGAAKTEAAVAAVSPVRKMAAAEVSSKWG